MRRWQHWDIFNVTTTQGGQALSRRRTCGRLKVAIRAGEKVFEGAAHE